MSVEPTNPENILPVLDLHSERYGPTGNVAAAGIQNQLGRPKLDRLTVLVREALQNSWDARVRDGKGMRMHVELTALDSRKELIIKKHVLAHQPPPPAIQLDELFGEIPTEGQEDSSPSSHLRLLMFSDRHTTGLGGPTRADVVSGDGCDEARDFVDFLRNVGQPPDREFSGGTYGYGKAILYNTSAIRTILVYTRCMSKGEVESRFIAARLGEQFTVEPPCDRSGIYTGRHWWGKASPTECFVEPLRGEDADRLAESLGMARDFEPGERGTTIAIVAPELDQRAPERAIRYIGEQIIWNFWALLRSPSDYSTERMELSLWLDNERIPVPTIDEYEPVSLMCRALTNLEAYLADEDLPFGQGEVIECTRYNQVVGHLSLFKGMVNKPQWLASNTKDRELLPTSNRILHHVALMRAPRIVVRYEEGDRFPSDMLHYGGVFLADLDVDHVFSSSEPPTHDDWVPEHLSDKTDRSVVKMGLKEIKKHTAHYVHPPEQTPKEEEQVDLGRFSRVLGGLLVGQIGTGAEVTTPAKKRKKKRPSQTTGILIEDDEDASFFETRKKAARIHVEQVELAVHDEKAVTLVRFRVNHAEDEQMTPVRADLRVVLESGKSESIKDNNWLDMPHVLLWREYDSGKVLLERSNRIELETEVMCEAMVSMPAEARLKVRLLVDRSEEVI